MSNLHERLLKLREGLIHYDDGTDRGKVARKTLGEDERLASENQDYIDEIMEGKDE